MWVGMGSPLTRAEVQKALDGGRLTSDPVGAGWDIAEDVDLRRRHAERVAYLVVHGWDDPIDIDPFPGDWPIQDGNHRLAAAFFREDTDIDASFWGDLEMIRETFGDEITKRVEQQWDERELCVGYDTDHESLNA